MHKFLRATLGLLAMFAALLPATAQGRPAAKRTAAKLASASHASVRRVQVLSNRNATEIEIEGTARLTPQAQILTGPDRLVVDFSDAIPGDELHNEALNRGGIKNVRVGLFSSNPPVTRVVFDLDAARSFQVFPSGHTVIVKLSGAAPNSAGIDEFPDGNSAAARPGLVNTNFAARPLPISNAPPSNRPPLEVSFANGLLAIHSTKASLSEVLYAIHQQTGADIDVPAGAEQEQVAAEIGPGPAAEVLAHLLNGSRFNFLIVNSANDPRGLDRVILTPRAPGSMPRPSGQVAGGGDADDSESTQQAQESTAIPRIPPQPAERPLPQNAPNPEPRESDPPD
jgi:hypothetical protein